MILLADANVLIDFAYVDALDRLPRIAPVEVLDVIIDECRHADQPTLVDDITGCGIVVVETDFEQERAARAFRTDPLSMQDAMNLQYAYTRGRILLAGDLPLRMRAEQIGVAVHGSIWVIDRAIEQGLAGANEICDWLERLPVIGRRLPQEELERIRITLGCE